MSFPALYLVILVFLVNSASSARILGVFPIPSISHQVVFRAYTQELARNGHELVIITPDPALPKERPKDNVTEIDVSFSYEYIQKSIDSEDVFKRGVIADVDAITYKTYKGFVHLIKEHLKHPEVKNIIDGDQKFDLIVVEAFFSLPLIFSHFFKAPVIQFSSFHGLPENYETVGAVSSHPVFYPNFNRNIFTNMNLLESVKQIYYEIKLRYEFWLIESEENRVIKELYGPEAPTIDQLKNNVQMLFINTHALFEDNRPVPPSVKYLGGLHIQPLKEIPEDLKSYLDNSKRGVIYVSMGSNVLPSRMDEEMLNAFIGAFAMMPYDVLWKCDADSLKVLPENVRVQKWFPQRDMLVHPNIKVFVTQGGLQSTDEAIDAGVPLVGIAMLGDQFYNVNKYVELGIGVSVDSMTISAEKLVEAVKTVANDETYRKNIRHLRAVMHDQPETPVQRAIWWTEHVIRTGGTHLQSPAANVSWSQYLMLDVFVMLAVVVITLVFVSLKITRSVQTQFFGKKKRKYKRY